MTSKLGMAPGWWTSGNPSILSCKDTEIYDPLRAVIEKYYQEPISTVIPKFQIFCVYNKKVATRRFHSPLTGSCKRVLLGLLFVRS